MTQLYGPKPTQYMVALVPPDHPEFRLWRLIVEWRGGDAWCVTTGFQDCMDANGDLAFEAVPSEREDEWKARFRHSLANAVNLAQREVVNVSVNGKTLQDCIDKWPDYLEWKN